MTGNRTQRDIETEIGTRQETGFRLKTETIGIEVPAETDLGIETKMTRVPDSGEEIAMTGTSGETETAGTGVPAETGTRTEVDTLAETDDDMTDEEQTDEDILTEQREEDTLAETDEDTSVGQTV